MQLVTLDFETYYDNGYTLSKMTTEEYVRDSRFKVHCLAAKFKQQTGIIFPQHLGTFNLDKAAFLCHHAHFDGLILSHHYGIRPAFWFDTLSMARLALPYLKSHSLAALAEHFGLGVKTVPYNLFKGARELSPGIQAQLEDGCKHDVELTYEIFERLLPLVTPEELRVIDLTIRMFTEPTLKLDREKMDDYLEKTIADKTALLSRVGLQEHELASAAKFAEALRAAGVEPPTKISPRTSKETLALAKTDAAFKDLCESDDDVIAALCAARLGVKSTLAETRAGRLLSADSRGALPVYLKYYGAHTGRWSGGDKMNWQNFPRGGAIRQSILAPDGYVIVKADLSQIECRMVNWLAGQEDVLNAFRSGRDIYCESASRFYGRAITKADKAERQIFKSVELGCGYGMGAKKFRVYAKQTGNDVTEAQADELIKFYRHTHDMVCRYWREAERKLELLATFPDWTSWGPLLVGYDRIVYPNGGYQVLKGLHKEEDGWHYTIRGRDQKTYGGLITENVTQGLSRVVLSQAMLKIAERYKVVLSEHDAVGWLAREEEAEEAYKFGMEVLTTNPEWCKDLPLAAEGGYGKRYGS